MRKEIDNIYEAIGALSIKQKQLQLKPRREIGYEAIERQRNEDK